MHFLSFDFSLCIESSFHYDDKETFFAENFRVLKPGGILLLTTPSVFGKPVLEFLAFVGLVSRQEIRDHKNYFNKKRMTKYGSMLSDNVSWRYTKCIKLFEKET